MVYQKDWQGGDAWQFKDTFPRQYAHLERHTENGKRRHQQWDKDRKARLAMKQKV